MGRILAIDDEIPILEALQTILEEMGHQVIICSNAEEGEQRGKEEEFDLILVDLRMPGRNGAEVSRAILEKRKGATILIITAFPGDPIAREALEAGAAALVKKPFEIGKILDFLAKTEQ